MVAWPAKIKLVSRMDKHTSLFTIWNYFQPIKIYKVQVTNNLAYYNKKVTVSHFHPGPIFTGKAGALPSGPLTGLHSGVRLLALSAKI